MVKTLQEKGFKNVGVLKFLVKKGTSPTDGNAGPLNMNVAERVGNARGLGIDEASPLGVINNATQVAAADPKYSIKSVEARKSPLCSQVPASMGKRTGFAGRLRHRDSGSVGGHEESNRGHRLL